MIPIQRLSDTILGTVKVKIIKFMSMYRMVIKFIYTCILIIVCYISHANV